MPATVTNETTVRLADGQVLVLTENDKVEQSTQVTIFCDSPRCEARNQVTKSFTYKPSDVAGDDFKLPIGSDQFISLVLSVRSPSYNGSPKNFCGPQCIKDFLAYTYIAPPPRTVSEQPPVTAEAATQTFSEFAHTQTFSPEVEKAAEIAVKEFGKELDGYLHLTGQCVNEAACPNAESQADGCSDPADVHGV